MARRAMDGTYSRGAIAFHWIIAALVIFNLAVGLLPFLGGLFFLHKAIGITVLALTIGRIAWRLAHRPPPLPAHVAAWERGVAHATHWTLYGLLLLMPLSGWAMVSGTAKRRPLDWFGLFDIPYLPVSKAVGDIGHDAHGLLGWLMLALVALHIGAALRHHLILRDGVLARMIPALGR